MKRDTRKESPVLGRLLRYMRPHLLFLVLALLAAAASVGLTLYGPVLIGRAIDMIVGPGQVKFTGVLYILLWLAGVYLLAAVFQWAMTLCTNRVAFFTVRDLRRTLFDKLQKVPLRFIDQSAHGDLITRMVSDIDLISDGLLQGFAQLFTGVITIVGTLLFMLSINVKIALVVVLITPLSLFVASFIARHSHDQFRRQSAARGDMGALVEEMVAGQKVVRAFRYESRAQDTFDGINQQLYQCGVRAQFYSSMTNPCTRFVNGLVYAGVGIIGAVAAIAGHLTVGQISAFLTYANQYTKPFNEISGVVTELQSAFASARRVFAVLDEPDEPTEAPAVLPRSDGSVGLEQVSFRYSPQKPLIEDFSLAVQPGQRIAIVGPTGCGKTTIINLLMRFYDVNSGRICISGTDIQDVTRQSVRQQYGMVLQDSWLFSGTVRQNIAYARPDATDEEIVAAAKFAHAHSFIKRLPQGYDTVIGEDGGSISQGQRQLLCIARILLVSPPMLILDEATSNIDTRTEQRIQRALAKLMEGRTSFVVAHRLSTIKEADNILVMRDGHIVEQGRHQQLLDAGGFYAKLYASQFEVQETAAQ